METLCGMCNLKKRDRWNQCYLMVSVLSLKQVDRKKKGEREKSKPQEVKEHLTSESHWVKGMKEAVTHPASYREFSRTFWDTERKQLGFKMGCLTQQRPE